jgi:hypothetical protein
MIARLFQRFVRVAFHREAVCLIGSLSLIGVCSVLFPPVSSFAATNVSGVISSDTTWTPTGSPYIVTGDVTVDYLATLTIEPGVVVKFQFRSSIYDKVCLYVNGVLNAQGTAGSPIVFSSERDDAHGGDSNGDGSATSPGKGDWGFVKISNTGSTIEYCQFWYGGRKIINNKNLDYMLWVSGPNPAVPVAHCQFHHSYGEALRYECGSFATSPSITDNVVSNCNNGIHVYGNGNTQLSLARNTFTQNGGTAVHVSGLASASTINQNTFSACVNALRIQSCSPQVQNNTITNISGYPFQHVGTASPSYSGNTVTGSVHSVVAVSGMITANQTWSDITGLGYPYLVESDVTVDYLATLTIEPGVVIKFQFRSSIYDKVCLYVNGVLNAQGTAGSPIVFSSERDDAHGGDSNGDGSATSPGKGDWGFVKISNTGSTIEYCQFWYGGRKIINNKNLDYMLWVSGPNPAVPVAHCQFHHSYGEALRYECGSFATSPSITDNVVSNCNNGIHVYGNGNTQLSLARNTFTQNGGTAVHVSGLASASTINQNTFSACVNALRIQNCSPQVQNNTITNISGYPFQHVGTASPSYSGNTVTGSVHSVVAVSGMITANQTWSDITGLGYPYLVESDVTVDYLATLTIEPGVVVKFQFRSSIYDKVCLYVNGVLNAQGTAGSPIVFSSERDDAHGGDSNGDGSATSPGKGDWGFVKISNTGSTIEYCQFWYGGRKIINNKNLDYMLWVSGPNPAVPVAHCQFHHSYGEALRYECGSFATSPSITDNVVSNCNNGIHVYGNGNTQLSLARNTFTQNGGTAVHVSGLASASTINQNTFSACVNALRIQSCSPQVQNNTITNISGYPFQHVGTASPSYSGNTVTGSVHSVVAVSGMITANQTWSDITGLGYPYLVESDVTVDYLATLTIEPGVVIKFQFRSSIYDKVCLYVNGVLNAQGTAGSPIVFSSERDDAHGGDSNGDGSATSPGKGDWGFVKISNTGSTIEYCQFWYGGRKIINNKNLDYMLWVDTPSIAIRRCTFQQSYDSAIYYSSSGASANFLVSATSFQNCPTGIKYAGSTSAGSSGSISGNEFQNGSIGVDVQRVGSYLALQGNNFSHLTSYGVRNTDTSNFVLAQSNWWGDSSGPSGFGSGTGIPVSDYVDFSNWWTSASQDHHGIYNVYAQRRGDTMLVDVYYDLVGNTGCTYRVNLAASTTGGQPYSITPPQGSLSGAIGSRVNPGTGLHIVWDAGYGEGGRYTNMMRVKVTADLEP